MMGTTVQSDIKSLCNVKVNIMGERPLVAIGRKTMNRIRDNMQAFGVLLFCITPYTGEFWVDLCMP